MEEFVIHPLVYPTIESIIRDIHFKTFKDFEGVMILDQKYNFVESTDDFGKFHNRAFLLDKYAINQCKRK